MKIGFPGFVDLQVNGFAGVGFDAAGRLVILDVSDGPGPEMTA